MNCELVPVSRADGRSDPQVIFDLTHAAVWGATFDYNVLEAALSVGVCVPITRPRIRSAVQRANRLLKSQKRRLVAVAGVGYRIALPKEHGAVARGFGRKAVRSLTRARDTVDAADLAQLTNVERLDLEVLAIQIVRNRNAIITTNRRIDSANEAIAALQRQQKETQDRLTELEKQMIPEAEFSLT